MPLPAGPPVLLRYLGDPPGAEPSLSPQRSLSSRVRTVFCTRSDARVRISHVGSFEIFFFQLEKKKRHHWEGEKGRVRTVEDREAHLYGLDRRLRCLTPCRGRLAIPFLDLHRSPSLYSATAHVPPVHPTLPVSFALVPHLPRYSHQQDSTTFPPNTVLPSCSSTPM